jgi:sialate O-acetylesterase
MSHLYQTLKLMNKLKTIDVKTARALGIIYLLLISFCPVNGAVKLPKLISDGMVLQRDKKLNVWGWASPGEKISIGFNGKNYHAVTTADGKWVAVLPAMKPGGPYTMDISATNVIHIKDILIGDVWLCSGQSNMQMTLAELQEKYSNEITQAEYPQIRQFLVPNRIDSPQIHQDLTGGQWLAATPINVLNFSGAAYFFALTIYKKYHIPIGIVNASWGGTPIEAWISEEGLKDFPAALTNYHNLMDTAYMRRLYKTINEANRLENERTARQYDQGLNGPKTWYDTTYDSKAWRQMQVPGYWNDQGIRPLNGVVWYRKEINLPKTIAGQTGILYLGRMVYADEVYVNGVLCGRSSHLYVRRRYPVAAGLLKPGKNIIVVRIACPSGKGGFVPDKTYALNMGEQSFDLSGTWQYKVGQVFPPAKPDNGNPNFTLAYQPVQLYNTMIAPVLNYQIKGVLWYQGESNTGKAKEYEKLLPILINNWRKSWKDSALPFLYAQLPNYMEIQFVPSESQWAELREAQLKTLAVPNTAMAVTIDLGEWNDIHPLNKKDVGYRLALAAERMVYDEKALVSSGPAYRSSVIENNRVIIDFNNVGNGLIAKGGVELAEFTIAGADKKFVPAKAAIRGNQVIVSADGIDHPLYVRYAWADNPAGANLYNAENLPACPFRTDGQ